MGRLTGSALALAVLLVLGACNPAPSWYQSICMGKGYERDSPAYLACVQRELQWLDLQRQPPPAPIEG